MLWTNLILNKIKLTVVNNMQLIPPIKHLSPNFI